MIDSRTIGHFMKKPSDPRPFDLTDPKEINRLLDELSDFLREDKKVCRKAFLNDGTDAEGRQFAIEALDHWHWERYRARQEGRQFP
jgi:hypothetical protein